MVRSTRSTHSARRPTTRSMTGLATRSMTPGLVTRSMSRAAGTSRRKAQSDLASAIPLCGGRYRKRRRRNIRSVVNTTVESDKKPRVSKRRDKARVAIARRDTRVPRKAGNSKVRGKSANTKRRAARQRSPTPAAGPALGKRLESVVRENKELTRLVNEYKTAASQHLLKNLEENFACPLCFEIMACPHTLRSPSCGHTFCATCILKWFFSHLHRSCGDWHDMVQCPMCRCPFATPDHHHPRSEYTFPFMPNRTLDSAIQGQIKSLADGLDIKSSSASNVLAAWSEGGHAKQDWTKRDRAGRNEMTSLGKQWATMKAVDFVNFKNRLDV